MVSRLPFFQQLKYERERHGWSQAEVAARVGTDTKTVTRWENGKSRPRPYFRQLLCELFGKSVEEFGLLDHNISSASAASHDPVAISTEQTILDNDVSFPVEGSEPSGSALSLFSSVEIGKGSASPDTGPLVSWGEAPYVENFYGRDQEVKTLTRWLLDDHCRLVAILGMGGMGKTTLASYLVSQIKDSYDYIFWRSLQNVPPLEHLLRECLQFLSNQQDLELPGSSDDQILLLMQYLRKYRCLLVLDNAESLMQGGLRAGQYRAGYESYGKLFRQIGDSWHRSCLLMTGREKPGEFAFLEGRTQPVQSIHIAGVNLTDGQAILKDKNLFGADEHWETLINHYAGNPLALKLVSEYIEGIFQGDISLFLQEEELAFGDINDLLEQQFLRLSKQEQEILFWLAIEREATALEKLRENIVRPVSRGALLEALSSLQHRFLIETPGSAQFFLQPVVMEYLTEKLMKQALQEFIDTKTEIWSHYAFIKAQATDYVRESQKRCILHPLAELLLSEPGKERVEQNARDMLSLQRQLGQQRSYMAGNILNLLVHIQSDLRAMDFSALPIQQAYLQGVPLHGVNFEQAYFSTTAFTNTFGDILSVAFSPLGRFFAIGNATGDIWIYRTMEGTPLYICSGHSDSVWSIVFSKDERWFVSSSDDHIIRVWDVNTGSCLQILQGHANRVRSVALSPDNTLLASGSDDETIRIWEVKTGHCLHILHGRSSEEQSGSFRVWSVTFNFDGTLLASGSTDGTIYLWETHSWQCIKTLQGHVEGIRSIAFSPDGKTMVSGGNDQTIRLWEVSTGKCFKVLREHKNRVWSVAFSPDGRFFASGSEDHTVRLWDANRYYCLNILQQHTRGVRSVSFNADAKVLASGGDDQTVRLWNPENGYCLRTIQGYTNRIRSVAFSPDANLLVGVYEDQIIRLWNVNRGSCTATMQAFSLGVRVVAFNVDGRILASAGEDQAIQLWDVNTGRRLTSLQGHTNWIWSIVFSPDGKMLASGSEDQTIRLWDVDTGLTLFVLQGHTSWVKSVSFSPDGKMLASGSDDQTIKLWDVTTGHCLLTLKGHANRIRSVMFSPDGKTLASGGEDQTIRLWETETGHQIGMLQGHTSWVRSVAFSADGRILASGGEDQGIRLWEIATGRCVSVLEGHTGRIRSIVFSPSGLLLASGSDDGSIICWDISTLKPLKVLRSERPYEGMNITHVKGLTEAQKAVLKALGAIELNVQPVVSSSDNSSQAGKKQNEW